MLLSHHQNAGQSHGVTRTTGGQKWSSTQTLYIWCQEVVSKLTHATIEYLHSHPTKMEEQDLQQIIGMLARLEASQNDGLARKDGCRNGGHPRRNESHARQEDNVRVVDHF
jgi:hypothetical protein